MSAATATTYTDILTHQHGRILLVTLNRPQRLNAWNNRMYLEYGNILDNASENNTIACVVLTGSGKCFSAGQDVNELSSYPIGATGAPAFDKMLRSHVTFQKPIIAAVNGLAIDWGCTLLATCDLVFMANSAKIRVPFTSLGLAPEGGSSKTFPALMRQEANWLLFSSCWFSASDCKRCGLAFKVVADLRLETEVTAAARTIASQPIASLIATKRLILGGKAQEILEAHDREQKAFAGGLLGGPANVEALLALKERRLPNFSRL